MKKIILITTFVLAMTNANAKISPITPTIKALLVDTLSKDNVDPVCKMKIKSRKITSNYEKIAYAFCSESCKKNFITDPKKYIKK